MAGLLAAAPEQSMLTIINDKARWAVLDFIKILIKICMGGGYVVLQKFIIQELNGKVGKRLSIWVLFNRLRFRP